MEWSFLPPFAGLKQTRSQAGLLAYGIILPTRHAFPFDVNSGHRVAFVADYSCEGSGGFAPRFPNTCCVPGCQCGLNEALVCFKVDRRHRHNSEPRAHDPQSGGFCKASNKRRYEKGGKVSVNLSERFAIARTGQYRERSERDSI